VDWGAGSLESSSLSEDVDDGVLISSQFVSETRAPGITVDKTLKTRRGWTSPARHFSFALMGERADGPLARRNGGPMFLDASATATTSPLNALTAFATAMVALSIAAERVTETIKQWAAQKLNRLKPSGSAAVTQAVAMLSGIFVTAMSGQNPLSVPGFSAYAWKNLHDWASWILGGILVSGGSAFWNHILDILQATKVQKESTANQLLPQGETIAS
jgi:hypothetical protein